MYVVGVDGWRSGWIAVVLGRGGVESMAAFESFADLMARHAEATVIGVDMPIGLPTQPPRACDQAARRLLGPRRSSVFPAPPRDVLEATTYADARALSTERYGRSVSAQSYALRHRILEVDAAATEDGVRDRIYEVHPELAFSALAGDPVPWSKKTWNGLMRRRRLLLDEGIAIPDVLEGTAAPVAPDDVVDAAAVAWSSRRIAQGDGIRLPEDDAGEFGMTIWY